MNFTERFSSRADIVAAPACECFFVTAGAHVRNAQMHNALSQPCPRPCNNHACEFGEFVRKPAERRELHYMGERSST